MVPFVHRGDHSRTADVRIARAVANPENAVRRDRVLVEDVGVLPGRDFREQVGLVAAIGTRRHRAFLLRPHFDGEVVEFVEIVVVGGQETAVYRPRREIHRAAHGAGRAERLVAVRRFVERRADAGRLTQREHAFAEVPDADVAVVPDVRRIDRRREPPAVVGGDLRRGGERRNLDPDGRHAVRVPRVDLAGEEVSGGVGEAQVASFGLKAVGVGEAGGAVFRHLHENREVRERPVRRAGERDGELARILRPVVAHLVGGEVRVRDAVVRRLHPVGRARHVRDAQLVDLAGEGCRGVVSGRVPEVERGRAVADRHHFFGGQRLAPLRHGRAVEIAEGFFLREVADESLVVPDAHRGDDEVPAVSGDIFPSVVRRVREYVEDAVRRRRSPVLVEGVGKLASRGFREHVWLVIRPRCLFRPEFDGEAGESVEVGIVGCAQAASASPRREIHRAAHGAGRAEGLAVVLRRIEVRADAGGFLERKRASAEVPDADEAVRPHVRWRVGGRVGAAVVGRDARGAGERRHLDPDERFAAGGPCIDFAGEEVAGRVGEAQVGAKGLACGVVEAVALGGKADEDRDVLDRRRSGVAGEHDVEMSGEGRGVDGVGGGGRGASRSRKDDRGDAAKNGLASRE